MAKTILHKANTRGHADQVDDQKLNTRDGFGIWETDTINIKADSDAEFLLMEVPMDF